MGEQRLRALAVRLAAVDAAAAGHADRQRRGEVARRAVAQPRRLGHDLVARPGRSSRRTAPRPPAAGRRRAMPIAEPTMPPSEIGASNTRERAVLGLQALGAAEHAAEVAHVLAVDHHVVVALEHHVHRRAQRLDHRHARHVQASPRACCACRSCSLQVRRHVLVDILEHRSPAAARGRRSACRWLLGLLQRGGDLGVQFLLRRARARSSDQAPMRHQVLLQPRDRVAEREVLPVVGRAGSATGRRRSSARRRGRSPIRSASARGCCARARRPSATPRSTARKSLPSTRSDAMPQPTPRAAKVVASPPAMAWKVEIAHWLLTTFRITGAR